MKKKKRIFIGYSLSKETQLAIADWQTAHETFPFRWISSKNLHITLIPPWYEGDVRGIITRLQNAPKSISPFAVRFINISFGPDRNRPRLIWATGNVSESFIALKNYLSELLQKEKEKRSPLLHVTLARFRAEQGKQFANAQLPEKTDWKEIITNFSVFESHLHKTGAKYELLAQIPLT